MPARQISPHGPQGSRLCTQKHEDFNSDLIYELTKGPARLLLVGMLKQRADEDESFRGLSCIDSGKSERLMGQF